MCLMSTPPGFTGPVNLGNPIELTMLQLAELILRLTNSSSKLVYRDLPSDDPSQRRPDIDLARTQLGWEPRIGLEDGLKRVVDYFAGTIQWKD
jgi:UDP-glucuronate decarboxylase